MPGIETNAAIARAGTFHKPECILQGPDHGERHQLEAHSGSALCRLRAQLGEYFDQARHRCRFLIEITDLHVMCLQSLGSIEQQLLANIRLPLAVAIKKPVGEELEFDVLDPVVVENLLHLLERASPEHMLKVGVPDSKPGEAGSA